MRIGVFVSGWEQGCCGEAARVGDHVTWELTWGRAWIAESFGRGEAAGVDFAETHHGGDDAPRTTVTGTITSAQALRQRLHRPDAAGPWTYVTGASTSVAVDRVPGHDETDDETVTTPGYRIGDRVDVPAPSPDDPALRPVRPGFSVRSVPADALDLAGRSGTAGWRVWLDVEDGAALPEAPPA